MNARGFSTVFIIIDLSGSMSSGAKLLIIRNLIDTFLFLLRRLKKYGEDFPLQLAYAYSSIEEMTFMCDEDLPGPGGTGGSSNLDGLKRIIEKYSDSGKGPILFFTDQVSRIPVTEHLFVVPVGDEITGLELESRGDTILPGQFASWIECVLEKGELP